MDPDQTASVSGSTLFIYEASNRLLSGRQKHTICDYAL